MKSAVRRSAMASLAASRTLGRLGGACDTATGKSSSSDKGDQTSTSNALLARNLKHGWVARAGEAASLHSEHHLMTYAVGVH